jgi:heme exporter protein D
MDPEQFFRMGGYAAYVWPSYGLALLLLVANLIATRRRHRRVLQHINALLKQERKKS